MILINLSHFKSMQVTKVWAVLFSSPIVKDDSNPKHTPQKASMQQSNGTPKLK